MSYEELKLKYPIKGTILDYRYVIFNIPESWKTTIKTTRKITLQNLYISSCLSDLTKPVKGARIFYDKLISNENNLKVCNKWQSIFHCDFIWKTIFTVYRYKLKDVKLLDFQYRFLHGIIYTKKELLTMNLVDDSVCSFCNAVNEDVSHVF